MGRLIDADRLKEGFHEDVINTMGTIDDSTVQLLMIGIDECPTAYDVDKVVEQLKEYERYVYDAVSDEDNYVIDTEKAIEIVKGSGQG